MKIAISPSDPKTNTMFDKTRSICDKATPFQVVSDLHLEVNQEYLSFEIPVCAEHLILAGDVGSLVDYDHYCSFLQKQTERFKLVLLILGNHEFYNDTFAAGLQRAQRLEQEPSLKGRLILLHRGCYDIPGSQVTVIGCTLWSNIPEEARDMISLKTKDFKKIQDWTVDSHNECHSRDIVWLLDEIKAIQSRNRSLIVVTHHAPSLQGTSNPQYANSPWSCAFATDVLSRLPEPSGIISWVFGHTHYTTEFKHQGIRVMANQRGYVLPSKNPKGPNNGFDVGKVIHV